MESLLIAWGLHFCCYQRNRAQENPNKTPLVWTAYCATTKLMGSSSCTASPARGGPGECQASGSRQQWGEPSSYPVTTATFSSWSQLWVKPDVFRYNRPQSQTSIYFSHVKHFVPCSPFSLKKKKIILKQTFKLPFTITIITHKC